MAFGNSPKDNNNIPMGGVSVPNHTGGDLTALRGASASTDSNGNETASVAVNVENGNANGQTTMSASSPVVIASDQSSVRVTYASNNASVPTGAANTIVKATAGALATLVVTTAGTGAGNVQIFDNATTNAGLLLFAFPATVSLTQFYQVLGWAKNGITVQNVANGPVVTVYFS